MKMLPVQLSLNPPLGLWSDVLWRCPPAPPSQLAELKTQLPASLPSDPRLWGREDVNVFLRFCEREFDLPKLDHDLFQMNGKALCLLTRADFGHRCPGAGDVLHNVLQMLIIESYMMQWHLPNSPVTPTSRYPLSPHSHPPTPTWPPIAPPENAFHNTHMHHFMAPNSVTLSPPPSVDSQASSPPQGQDQNGIGAPSSSSNGSNLASCSSSASTSSSSSVNSTPSITLSGNNSTYGSNNTSASIGSNHFDSDEENYSEPASKIMLKNNAVMAATVAQYNHVSPPSTPVLKDMPKSLTQQIATSFINSWQQSTPQSHAQKGANSGGSVSAPTTPSFMQSVKREFFPENSEPNTNGRLLWDFLQQLLNDRNQKYSDLIAWKCRDTGVFKIVDPAGLAKLWGIQKNHLSMNYDKMSRALRYYYRVNILRKVQGERHCYQFLRNPSELKNIKNISLLRQTVTNSGNSTNGSNSSGSPNGVSGSGVPSSNLSPNANSNNSGWSVPHQGMQNSAAGNVGALQLPQRPASRSSNHMTLPSISTSAAAAAAVAAATAAGYGPPPTSPLFMHAINGAFQYLSSNSGPPPNSPAPPSTPNDKFQFNSALKMEHNGQESSEDMKPTDLSVAGAAASNSEKRPYSSSSANEECYPLIRNADGLTTIKLIRYNDSETMKTVPASSSSSPTTSNCVMDRRPSSESPKHHMAQQEDVNVDEHSNSVGESTDNGTSSSGESNQYGVAMMATDLRK